MWVGMTAAHHWVGVNGNTTLVPFVRKIYSWAVSSMAVRKKVPYENIEMRNKGLYLTDDSKYMYYVYIIAMYM